MQANTKPSHHERDIDTDIQTSTIVGLIGIRVKKTIFQDWTIQRGRLTITVYRMGPFYRDRFHPNTPRIRGTKGFRI